MLATSEEPRVVGRPELVASLLRALAHTAVQHAQLNEAIAPQLGIGPTDLECLALLHELGPTTAGQLAEVLSLTTGAITGVVDRMATAGFVVRESDPSDRRRVIVRPIEERMAELARAYEPVLEDAFRALGAYSEADLRLILDFQRRASDVFRQQMLRLKAEHAPSAAATGFTAPLGNVQVGALEFANGASELFVYATDRRDDLYRATFEGPQPTVRVQDGSITVRHKRMGLLDWGKHSGEISLNPTIPWRIALRGGASAVSVDARELQLQEFVIEGGASKVEALLPHPSGTVRVSVDGGASRLDLRRPAGVPAHLQVRGGANGLGFDAQRFGAVGGDLRLASPGWELATDRYDIEVRGGASRLTVDRQ